LVSTQGKTKTSVALIFEDSASTCYMLSNDNIESMMLWSHTVETRHYSYI